MQELVDSTHTHTHTHQTKSPGKPIFSAQEGPPRTYCKILAGSAHLCPERCLPLGTLAHLHNSCVFAVTRQFLMKESSSKSSRESTDAMGGRWNLFQGDCLPLHLWAPLLHG